MERQGSKHPRFPKWGVPHTKAVLNARGAELKALVASKSTRESTGRDRFVFITGYTALSCCPPSHQ